MSGFVRLLLTIISTFSAASADTGWKSELSPATQGPHPRLVRSVLDLQLSWKGMIRSGTLRIDFDPVDAKKPGTYVVRSSASSLGAAAAIFPYQSHFWAELDPTSLRPRYFHTVETDKKESVTTHVRYFNNRVEVREIAKLTKTGATTTTDELFKFAPVFDIFSAMLHIRSQKLATGDRLAIVVCPFKTPYLLRIHVVGREVHNGRKAIKLTLGMRKINRKTMELQAYKKLRKDATLWLSDDTDRVPLELRAAAFIGDVRATLVKHRKP